MLSVERFEAARDTAFCCAESAAPVTNNLTDFRVGLVRSTPEGQAEYLRGVHEFLAEAVTKLSALIEDAERDISPDILNLLAAGRVDTEPALFKWQGRSFTTAHEMAVDQCRSALRAVELMQDGLARNERHLMRVPKNAWGIETMSCHPPR